MFVHFFVMEAAKINRKKIWFNGRTSSSLLCSTRGTNAKKIFAAFLSFSNQKRTRPRIVEVKGRMDEQENGR